MSSDRTLTYFVWRLLELQELDLQSAALDSTLAGVRARLADDSAVVSLKDQISQLDVRLKEPTSERGSVEATLQQLEDRLQTVEGRLYGGTITNPRELEAHQEDRNLVQKQRSGASDKLLELMVEIEELHSGRDEARERLGRLEAERKVERTGLRREVRRLVGELEDLHQQREVMVPHIPPSALSVYENLRRSKGGYAVAKVERALCQGCRLVLPTLELQRARASQGIVQCNSCRRILYAD